MSKRIAIHVTSGFLLQAIVADGGCRSQRLFHVTRFDNILHLLSVVKHAPSKKVCLQFQPNGCLVCCNLIPPTTHRFDLVGETENIYCGGDFCKQTLQLLACMRFIFYDHPSGYDRVRMAMQWKSENQDSEP